MHLDGERVNAFLSQILISGKYADSRMPQVGKIQKGK